MLPLPLKAVECTFWSCCGKVICSGCIYDQVEADKKEGRITIDTMRARICPFCRTEEINNNTIEKDVKLAKAGNHNAIYRIGSYNFHGEKFLQQDKEEGIKWWRRAAEAGSPWASHNLGVCYMDGEVVGKDVGRALEYFQKSAELGAPQAFVGIGTVLMEKDAVKEAYLNHRKAVICGYSDKRVFDLLRKGYKDGFLTKEEYAYTLREHQKASDEMKSESREMMKKLRESPMS